jgi:hypothetical protein
MYILLRHWQLIRAQQGIYMQKSTAVTVETSRMKDERPLVLAPEKTNFLLDPATDDLAENYCKLYLSIISLLKLNVAAVESLMPD